jgi:glutamate carboxypeptidase
MPQQDEMRSTLVATMSARLPAIRADIEALVRWESPSSVPDAVAKSADLVAAGCRAALVLEASVGGASDGNFTAGVGTPTLDGLGAVGGGAHADHEHVLVEALPGRAALLAALIDELLAGGPHPAGGATEGNA